MTLSETNKLNRISKVLRFFLALAIFIWLLWLAPKLTGQETVGTLMLYGMFPMMIFSIPAALIGLYFIITTKFRMRLDIILLLILIFLLSTLYKFMIPQQPSGDISGNTRVEITLLNESQQSLTNVEVDLGNQPGTPPSGGRQLTNSKGVATFFVKPGKYSIYFNDISFPKDLMKPVDLLQINVEERKSNTKTIILNFR
jgi:hypothetical protein